MQEDPAGALAPAQEGRDLGIGAVQETGQEDDAAVVLGKLLQGPVHPFQFLPAAGDAARGGRVHAAGGKPGLVRGHGRVPGGVAALGPPVAAPVHDLAVGGAEQPAYETGLAAVLEAAEVLEDLPHRGLHQVRGVVPACEQPAAAAPDVGLQGAQMAGQEFLQGGAVQRRFLRGSRIVVSGGGIQGRGETERPGIRWMAR